MKKMVRKIISTVMVAITLALVITSCQKEQSTGKYNTNNGNVDTGLVYGSSVLTFPTCAPIPDSLKVPEGNSLVLQTFARGLQIYEVKRSATDPNVYAWVNIAPSATLYTNPNFTNQVINHFAGPSWKFIKGPEKGETVVAKKVSGVTPDATAIQWLLLKAVDSLSTPNIKITFVQRICTVGGLAPTTGADAAHLGTLDSVPYTASYLFYVKN